MGGNAFEYAESIDIKHLYEIWPIIYKDLTLIGCKEIKTTGSTFRKLVMGDIDIVCSNNYNNLLNLFLDKFGKENVKKIGTNTISILWNGYVQIDVIAGNSEFILWTHYGPPTLPGVEHSSQFKGTLRHILMSAILYNRTVKTFTTNTDEYRTCYQFDIENGIFKTFQTKLGTRNNKLKKWKTLSKELIAWQPQQTIDFIFGKHSNIDYQDVYTFEELYKYVKYDLKKDKEEIIKYFLRDVEINVTEKPLRIASSQEEAYEVLQKLKTIVNN